MREEEFIMTDDKKTMSRKEFEAMVIAKAWKDSVYKQELLKDPKV